jgi:ankyrin repeat protein
LTPESCDRAGYTAIHAAASYGHLALLTFLIKDRNGDINVQDQEGDTPLHMCELVEVAREMIENLGADVTIKNKEGLTVRTSVMR